MERMWSTLVQLCFLILIIIFNNSPCKADVCKTGIDGVFQRLENPRYVILVSGSNFWEFDRFKGKLVKERVPLSKYWEGAPSSPGLVMATEIQVLTFLVFFYKDFIAYYYVCKKTIDRCNRYKTINIKDSYPATKIRHTFEAGFYYHKGMPTPIDSDNKEPFWFHVFAKENLDEFDCHKYEGVNTTNLKPLCLRNKVDKQLFPNFDKLKTEKQLIYAAEVFYNRTTNITDFLVVVDNSIRYTLNGKFKAQNIDDLFKCDSGYFWVTSIIIVLFLQVAGVTIFLTVIAVKAKSTSATL